MAQIRIDRPIVVHYPALLEFRAYISDLDPDEYVDYFWNVSRPDIVEEILHTNYTGRYVFKIFNEANMEIMLTAIIYKYNMNFEKITQEILTDSVMLYDETLEARYAYDSPPRPVSYDTSYEYENSLILPDLNFTVWQASGGVYELPYYIPIIVNATGGIPPYTYTWEIDKMGNETAPSHSMFTRDNICSLVFPQFGIYQLNITITDNRGITVKKEIEVRAISQESITSYKFDVKPEASTYDGFFIKVQSWSPPKDILSKNNNYYVGKYYIKLNLDDMELSMSDVLAQVKQIVNRTISPDQMYERYYASQGFSFYAMSSRAAVYYAGRTTLHSVYLDEEGFVCFNLRLTSDYPISSAISRTLQALAWVVSMNNIPHEIVDMNRKFEFKPTAHSDVVLDGMKAYVSNLVATKYARVELDERYDAIQTDVEVYLGKEHKYEYNGTTGYPSID